MALLTGFVPIYRLDGVIKLVTAAASWGTAIALIKVTPAALAMKSPEQLEREVEERTDELVRANTALTAQIAERKQAEAEVAALNARLQLSMSETHHRVKNNLQIVSALLDLQCPNAEGTVPVREWKRVSSHVRSLAAVHDLLTLQTKNHAELDFLSAKATLEHLLPALASVAGNRAILCEMDELAVPLRQTSSLSIIVNELLSNAVKHAPEGDIRVSLRKTEEGACLEVSDEGPGFCDGFDPALAANTGLELVEQLAKWDLQGEVEYRNTPSGGGHVVVSFPLLSEVCPTPHALHN
jgi:Signal transduction histidine kinase